LASLNILNNRKALKAKIALLPLIATIFDYVITTSIVLINIITVSNIL
jgi:hypothetical protein